MRPNDSTSLSAPVPEMLNGIDQGVHGLRIGLDEEYICGNTDPQVVEGVLTGIRVLEALGAVIVPISMPDTDGYLDAWATMCASEAVAAHEATYPSRRDDYGPWFQGWLDLGASVTGRLGQTAGMNAVGQGAERRKLRREQAVDEHQPAARRVVERRRLDLRNRHVGRAGTGRPEPRAGDPSDVRVLPLLVPGGREAERGKARDGRLARRQQPHVVAVLDSLELREVKIVFLGRRHDARVALGV